MLTKQPFFTELGDFLTNKKKHLTTYQNIVVVGPEDEDVVQHSTHSSSIIEYIYLRKSYKNIPEKIIFIQLILLPE